MRNTDRQTCKKPLSRNIQMPLARSGREGAAMLDSLEPRLMMTTVSGTVYNDLNANGHRDPGEPGLAGWVVNLRINPQIPGSVTRSAVSDGVGNYSFSGMWPPSAQFRITEAPQSGWQLTEPAAGYYYIPAGTFGTIGNRNFGNHYVGTSAPAPAPAPTATAPSTTNSTTSTSLFSTQPITGSDGGSLFA